MIDAEPALWLGSLGASVAFVALGYQVAEGRQLLVDRLAPWAFGKHSAAAVLLTRTGYAPFLAAAAVAAAAIAVVQHLALLPVALVIMLQIGSQLALAALKRVFRRMRPDRWLVRQELGFSYPSGHAATAVTFYGGWLWLASSSQTPVALRIASITALAFWALGICWSRVALGAHHPSDVAGGALFGSTFLTAGMAILHHYQ